MTTPSFFDRGVVDLSLNWVMSLLVLTATDVDRAASKTSPQDLLYLVAQVFIRLSSRTGFTAPPRLATRSENHVSLFMPAHIQDIGTAVKVVSVPHEQNASNGLPASTLVLDEVTGGVKAIVNARNLTALRTAAGTNVCCSYHGFDLFIQTNHEKIYCSQNKKPRC
jgi:ornithine cyclodeaminase/alanine dehydrogenase-like protein (mu-crystallin family)